MEDIRYHHTVPAQSVFGQVGCLAGRTIAYRRTAFEPAVERLVQQTVQITFVMVPIRIAAFATMFHQEWGGLSDPLERSRVRSSFLRPEPAQETVMIVPGESSP
jgi:hypothetical protein